MEKQEIDRLLVTIRKHYGYDFSDYSPASFSRRVKLFMDTNHIHETGKLESELVGSESLFESFVQNVSVTVTEMFRDPSFYKAVREKVLPRLATYPDLKIWVAGCATGEEVYSIAILLHEAGLLERSLIYATDLNQKSIRIAREGIFPIDRMKNYTQNYQRSGGKNDFSQYYKANFDAVLIDKKIRKNIVFAPHNLASDRSFNEFQLVLCRNVLIYFNQALQSKVISLFYESLCRFGFLGLGNKESLLFSDKRELFEEVDKKEKLFMKSKA
jgi:chemotaxis protein methyltransferase CheR